MTTHTIDTAQIIESLRTANRRLGEALGASTEPTWNDDVKERAERAVNGDVYQMPDGQWVHVDLDNIDWNAGDTPNPAHIIMVLRRFHVLYPLLNAYRATGDERYAESARDYIAAFLRDDPPRDDWEPVPGDGDTQYDIRVGVWLETLGEFSRSPAFDDALIEQIIQAVRCYLRYLVNNVRPDRNIRCLHGETLLLTGFRLPDLPEAGDWMAQGVTICNDAIRRQILPDGAHMEATPGYHGGMRSMFHTFWKLARGIPELGLNVPAERIAAMFDYELCATQPDGAVISLHDTRYTAAVRKADDAMLQAQAAFRREANLEPRLPDRCSVFPDAGQAYVRDDWSPQSGYLTFDAATRRSYHWHPSRNSITLFAHGRAPLVDPGYTFATDEFPSYGGRTAHHNTVSFNGWDQSDCPATVGAHSAGDYTLVQGRYGGGYWNRDHSTYGSGIYGQHDRMVLWLHGRFAVVLDAVQHTALDGGKPSIESCWQLSEGPAVCDPDARRVVTQHEQGNLRIDFPLVLAGSAVTMHEGERDPMRGWLPIEWGRRCIPAPLVRVNAPNYDPWSGDMATVLTPFAGPDMPEITVTATDFAPVGDSREAGSVRIDQADGTSDRVLWTRYAQHAIDHQHGLKTDGSLVHLRLSAAGDVASGLIVDGTHCEVDGVDVFGRLTALDRLPTK